ncbi:hypothetical protein M5722_002094, partial [Salmonella enterica]|nr:hypothetical protein [Salmonella enterica]EJX2429743.1 hypothetical protein [Salmonella enterica]EJX3549621.1 hypothetical protein [Salmonella enterica]
MSESLQTNATQTLPDDREELYLLVWREPAEKITSLYSISKEQLAKRCAELRIPRPFTGYWKALAKGTAPAVPPLPALKKGKAAKIQKEASVTATSPTAALPKPLSPAIRKQATITGNGYALINDLKTHLPKSSMTEDGYYKPAKKKLLDLNVSDSGFDSAIDFLSRFF